MIFKKKKKEDRAPKVEPSKFCKLRRLSHVSIKSDCYYLSRDYPLVLDHQLPTNGQDQLGETNFQKPQIKKGSTFNIM